MRRDSRRGAAVLTTVLVAIFVLVALALSLGVQRAGVHRALRRARAYEASEDLAREAIAEAMHHLRDAAVDPSHPLFEAVQPGPAGHLEADLAPSDLPHVEEALRSSGGFTLLGPVTARELGRRSLPGAAYDQFGAIQVSASVAHPSWLPGRGVTVSREYRFRSLLTSPHRPFDTLLFLLADPSSLLSEGAREGSANRTIEWCTRQLRERRRDLALLAAGLADAASELRRYARQVELLQPTQARRLERAATAAEEAARIIEVGVGSAWPADTWRVLPGYGQPGESEVHRFPPGLLVYALADQEDAGVDLSKVDLPRQVGPGVEAARRAARSGLASARALEDAVRGMAAGDPTAPTTSLARALVRDVHALARACDTVLGAYRDFQGELLGVEGVIADDFRARFAALDPSAPATRARLRDHAHFVFRGPRSAEAAEKFLARRPVPVGTVLVEGATRDLVLELREVSGRLTVTSDRGVSVREATLASPSDPADSLTIAAPRIEVSGAVDAALVVTGRDFLAPGGAGRGALLLAAAPDAEGRRASLHGELTPLPGISAGAAQGELLGAPEGRALSLAFSPSHVMERVERE